MNLESGGPHATVTFGPGRGASESRSRSHHAHRIQRAQRGHRDTRAAGRIEVRVGAPRRPAVTVDTALWPGRAVRTGATAPRAEGPTPGDLRAASEGAQDAARAHAGETLHIVLSYGRLRFLVCRASTGVFCSLARFKLHMR